MSERRGTKALETWCRRLTEGYPGVKIENMTTSWRDGLAFCAIIHHFRPDLIDFTSLTPSNIYYNNSLAFNIAERNLGIPALLDAEDMVLYTVPDRLSILTYLSQFYQVFGNNSGSQAGSKQGSAQRIVPKRSAITSDLGILTPASTSPPTKMASRSSISVTGNLNGRREPCAKCGLPVFLAERLNVGTKLYHRTCFRCARCNNQLSLANCYETETEGQYCCETCPDEEERNPKITKFDSLDNVKSITTEADVQIEIETKVDVKNRSLSDEEKAIGLQKFEEDDYSAEFEQTLEENTEKTDSFLSKAHSDFLTEQLLQNDVQIDVCDSQSHEIPPDDVNASADNSASVNNSESVNSNCKDEPLPASDAMLEDTNLKQQNSTKDCAISLVKQRMTLFETIDSVNSIISVKSSPEPEEQPEEVESANIHEDSVENEKTEDNVLIKSVIEDISMDQTEISLSQSILESSNEYPVDLNPFGDEPEEEEPKKQVIKPSMEDLTIITSLNESKYESTNPFGSSDEDNEEQEDIVRQKPPRPPLPALRGQETTKKVLKAPRISLNPFWSDEDDHSDEEGRVKPVPMPRSKHLGTPEAKPRRPSGLSNCASHYDSNSSLSSMNSSLGHTPGRRKKPAPLPPPQGGGGLSPQGSKQSSPSTSTQPSPKLTPRVRKARKAPPPPSSTPFISTQSYGDNFNISSIDHSKSLTNDSKSDAEESLIPSPGGSLASSDLEKEKNTKDEKNRNRQSQNLSSPVMSDSDSISISHHSSADKSTHGKWKRKKGPAPARPVPQRRQIRPLPLAELKRELDIIELQQQGLEKQGVKLEQLIREKCEIPGVSDDTALTPEVEELVLELFELVNEKNELFRKQAELMYLRRQQRLEEEHADLEYQIRCLMLRPEMNKTDSDKAREEELINRLLEVVERRNEIVECLEMDRVREAEEDQSINFRLSQLALKKEDEQAKLESPVKLSKKEKKKIKKEKKLKEKGKTLDADKDIDESENSLTNSTKEKKKKKWF